MIIRPTNVLPLLFLPFLFDSTKSFFQRIKWMVLSNWKTIFIGCLIIFSFLFFQLWNTHLQTGKWMLNTYSGEGFDNWKTPEIMNVLFSWRKGLFIYTPILILFIPGMIVLFRKNRRLFWGVVFFTSVYTYIVSSWWCWWYGGGLGARPFIDVFIILFLPIVFLLSYSNRVLKVVWIGLFSLSIWMYQIYEFQMKHNILHYENMNFNQFKTVFMKKDLRFGWFMHMEYDTIPIQAKHVSFTEKIKNNPKGWSEMYADNPYDHPIFAARTIDYLPFSTAHFGARIQCDLRLLSPETNPSYNVYLYKNDTVLHFKPIFLGGLVHDDDIPTRVSVDFTPPFLWSQFDSIQIEFTEGNRSVKAKNFNVNFYSF